MNNEYIVKNLVDKRCYDLSNPIINSHYLSNFIDLFNQ